METERVETTVDVHASYRGFSFPPQTASRLFSSARWAAINKGWLGIQEARAEGFPVFIVSQRIFISDDLSNAPRESVDGIASKCTMSIAKVGNSSFTMLGKVSISPTLTATNVVTYVFVQAETRKSCKIPAKVLEKLKIALDATAAQSIPEPARVADFKNAEEVHEASFTMRPSDTDWNGHVNQSQYFTFISDALEMQLKTEPRITACNLTYVKEAMAGDTMQVRWAFDDPEKQKISFRMLDTSGNAHALGSLTLIR